MNCLIDIIIYIVAFLGMVLVNIALMEEFIKYDEIKYILKKEKKNKRYYKRK